MRTSPARSGSISAPDTAKRRERVLRERLAEHGAVLEQSALLRGQAVEPGGDQRVQRLRHLQRLDLAGQPVRRPIRDEQPRSSSIRTVSTA